MGARKIVRIDEQLCDGCGQCVPSCAEGAIQIIDGKARLLDDKFCDGLGACLGECPQGAISIEEREAAEFDEAAVEEHLKEQAPAARKPRPLAHAHAPGGGCPGSQMLDLGQGRPAALAGPRGDPAASALGHWPVKLKLVPPRAPFLDGADLLLTADCVPFAHPDLHRDVLPGNAVVIGCPKFDDHEDGLQRLTDILREANINSLTVVRMEVPCCGGYWHMAQEALAASGKDLPLRQVVIGVRGGILEGQAPAAAAAG